ncbi:hypothetical protein [Chitinophaga rhizophila]|uniref:Uncharacterized protein n=1 Tax=Chitinophaga rhizophila TaxID=2866212 RepID=A0ABS7GFR2_9BACT|nr:hypothetical protein [Chitinophaga rhizophila]MBW8685955.1 hypothetical protein [Chitinophaga rhizophila]
MKRVLFILGLAVFGFSCNQTRTSGEDTSNYDIITEKSYVIREVKPAGGDPETDSILIRKQEMTSYLERQGFTRHVAAKEVLMFRRSNRQEVVIDLPAPATAAAANMIIVFDPMKNPLFINLKKDTTQVEHYINM